MDNTTGKRAFKGSDGSIFYITDPTAEDIKQADWQYSRVYTQCLTEGITTQSEMVDILRRRGIIGPEFDTRVQELTESLRESILHLSAVTDIDLKAQLSVEVSEKRNRLYEWNQRLNGPMSNTCENMADEARTEHLTSSLVLDSYGKRIWKTYKDFLNDSDNKLTSKAKMEVMLFIQGLSSDFFDQTPEAIAMREVRAEITQRIASNTHDSSTEEISKEIEVDVVVEEPTEEVLGSGKTTKTRTKKD